MHNSDVLGDEGRKALNACVKVKIYGKPETRKYDHHIALDRLSGCYADCPRYPRTWWDFDQLVLPWRRDAENCMPSYDIVDIREALVKFDERRCVEKYPEVVKQRELIDNRRAVVERELEEAIADPESRLRYSWLVAQRRVRDCFAGNFPEDRWTDGFTNSNSISTIHWAVSRWDEIRERTAVKRAALEKEYTEALTEGNVKVTLPRRPKHRVPAGRKMDHPLPSYYSIDNLLPSKQSGYDIFDIHEEVVNLNGKLLEKYPEEGPGSDELKKLIDKHRADLEEEYQEARSREGSNLGLPEYTKSEAERRVRDCFAGTFPCDTEIFAKEEDKSDQTYDIFDIKEAIDHFDAQKFLDLLKYKRKENPDYEKSKKLVDEERASVQNEYDEATRNIEVEHGSGFIVHDHFIITNRHVIETHLNDTGRYEIYISDAAIDDLPCTVVHCDPGKDLALLHCRNLEQCKIYPLQLSKQSVLPGMSVFTFGYPMSHTEETALFVSGNVSGSKRTLAGHLMMVLNCSLNSGNSGGPVLCWVNGQLKVLGVATQKHFKEILTLEERQSIENIRESLQTEAIPDLPDHIKRSNRPLRDYYRDPRTRDTPIALLTLKLYDALETHSQFNLSNALPGELVVDFIKDSMDQYSGEHKEELAEVVKLAKDSVNTL